MPTVNIPGLGTVNFPAGTPPEEMERSVREAMGKSGSSTFDTMSKRPLKEVAAERKKSIESGAGKAQYEQAMKSADEDIATSRGRVAKDVVLAGAAALAAPLTAGASLPIAAAIMAGTGATASLAAEGVKKVMGSREVAKNFNDLAWTVGFDTAMFGASEVGGRAIGAFVKKALPNMMMRSASQVAKGAKALNTMSERTLYGLEGRLQASVGVTRETLDVDIGGILRRTENKIAELPVGRGELGEQFASPTSRTQEVAGKIQRGLQARQDIPVLERQLKTAAGRAEKAATAVEETSSATGPHYAMKQKVAEDADALVKDISDRLEKARGADSTRQPLDVLVTIKGNAQKFAYEHAAWREGEIFKDMASNLDRTIKSNLKGDELELYNHYNTIQKARFDSNKVISFSNRFVNFAARRAIGSAIGGGLGYEIGGGKGALVGASLGVAMPNVSAFLLQRSLQNPQSRTLLRRAVDTWVEGSAGEANTLARRAFTLSGGRQLVRDAISSQREEAARPLDLAALGQQ